mmetsp:Transcript_10018/g.14428  ORF Transcript_10018/g.14428 Transcript_10018/m.14428 type:complete len:220 (+) Transcript_10018:2403-3062(+)
MRAPLLRPRQTFPIRGRVGSAPAGLCVFAFQPQLVWRLVAHYFLQHLARIRFGVQCRINLHHRGVGVAALGHPRVMPLYLDLVFETEQVVARVHILLLQIVNHGGDPLGDGAAVRRGVGLDKSGHLGANPAHKRALVAAVVLLDQKIHDLIQRTAHILLDIVDNSLAPTVARLNQSQRILFILGIPEHHPVKITLCLQFAQLQAQLLEPLLILKLNRNF